MPQYVADDIYVGSVDETESIGAMYGLDPEEAAIVRDRIEAMGGDFKTVMRKIGKRIRGVAKRVVSKVKTRAGRAASAASAAAQEPDEVEQLPAQSAAPAVDPKILMIGGAAVLLFILMRKKGR
jgi:hypothetical protein